MQGPAIPRRRSVPARDRKCPTGSRSRDCGRPSSRACRAPVETPRRGCGIAGRSRTAHQHSDAAHAIGRLRARGERPRNGRRGRRAADERDDLAAPHSITSSAHCRVGKGARPVNRPFRKMAPSAPCPRVFGCSHPRSTRGHGAVPCAWRVHVAGRAFAHPTTVIRSPRRRGRARSAARRGRAPWRS